MEAYLKLKKKLSDQHWRLNNLYWITDKHGKAIKFKFNWAQEQLWNDMWYMNIILKARQLGFTTLIDLYVLDTCLFNKNTKAGIIAHTTGDAKKIFRDKVKYAYERIGRSNPNEENKINTLLKENIKADYSNVNELVLSNGSSVSVGTSMRSSTLQILHVSEFAKISAKYPDKAREIVAGGFNTVQAGNQIFVESTSEGDEGRFYSMCQKAMEKRGKQHTKLEFKFHFYPWYKHPEYKFDDT